MKLSLGHNEIVAGICAYLASRGVTGFDPNQVEATFSVSRKDSGQVSCELNDTPLSDKEKAAAQAEREAGKTSAKTGKGVNEPAGKAGGSASKGGENAAAQAEPLSQAESPIAQVADETQPAPVNPQPSEVEVVPTSDTEAAAAPKEEGENLFG